MAYDERFVENLRTFYLDHTTEVLLPFWMKALDRQNGGVYTCYNNQGTELVSTDKYTWSQGRFVWLLSKLAHMSNLSQLVGDAAFYLDHAKKTIEFLIEHAILENGNCAFLLSKTGEKKKSIPGQGYDTSFYADCFVVLGFSEYARVARDSRILDHALVLYDRIVQRLKEGNIRSEPYPIPTDLQAHSVSMIMVNVTQELVESLKSFQHARIEELKQSCYSYIEDILEVFYGEDSLIAEMLPKHDLDANCRDTILLRHINPGHTIECMWFIMTTAEKIGRTDWIAKAAKAVKKAFELGWDSQYGGLLRFIDHHGGEPKGIETGDPYERLILDTWDTKLWWPHSETLYTTLLAYKLTGDTTFLSLYEQTHNYVFSTFPNPDQEIGEWIQIRDRYGNPIEKQVALPVKDPYHVLRNALLIIELLGTVQ